MRNWSHIKVLVIGAARQGLAVTRYLSEHGADVILNDKRSVEDMSEAIRSLNDLPVEWVLGNHPLKILDGVQWICVSGGVPLTLPLIVEGIKRGIKLTNDTQIFMDEVPCPVVGITGSNGKTTTTTLVGRISNAAVQSASTANNYRKTWVGGNIGFPLIGKIAEMDPKDLVILEISSFQLELMTRSPRIAALLNLTPNHLDRHKDMHTYAQIKARIFEYQNHNDFAILNREDTGAWDLRDHVKSKLMTFGIRPPISNREATYLREETLYLRRKGEDVPIMSKSAITLRGEHNLVNVLAACMIAHAAGFSVDDMQNGVKGFTGVPHRLQFVRHWGGADWYNDSIATNPESTIAAVRSFTEPLVLLLGGRDKNLPWEDLAALIHERVDHVIIFGEASDKIVHAIGENQDGRRPYSMTRCPSLQPAIDAAASLVKPGQVVLLSPGGTSFDEFRDFEERGECFAQWVNQLS